MSAPCKDCERRVVGCHAKCNDYTEYRQECNEANKKRREVNFNRKFTPCFERIIKDNKKYRSRFGKEI